MSAETLGQKLWNKIPEITIFFWVIKILCTTVGETAADYLSVSLNLGLTITSILTGVLLAIVLVVQFKTEKYTPSIYWLAVFLISIFGTLVTDNLTDALGVPLELSTIVFSILLIVTFAIWYAREKTLSIHSVNTWKRESFYWLAILFTFALGTAAGDLMAESLSLGYLVTGLIILGLIICITIAWKLKLNTVLAFWVAYILTRPLGASLGDYLSQDPVNGGLGMGPTVTTIIFVLAIIGTVIYLAITKKDQIRSVEVETRQSSAEWQVVIVILLIAVLACSGYFLRQHQLDEAIALSASSSTPLGDLSEFKQITNDTLVFVRSNDLADARNRIADLETAWDTAEPKLKSMSPNDWSAVDDAVDEALSSVRRNPDPKVGEEALVILLNAMNALDGQKPVAEIIPTEIPEVIVEPPQPVPIPTNTTQNVKKNTTVVKSTTVPKPVAEPTHGLLGDLSDFKTIAQDTLELVKAGDAAGAKNRITDLETAWDDAALPLKRLSRKDWTTIDNVLDDALSKVRDSHPDPKESENSLLTLLAALNSVDP